MILVSRCPIVAAVILFCYGWHIQQYNTHRKVVALNSHFNVTGDMLFLAWNVKLAYKASKDSWPV